jgi:hypothetical protein
MPETKKVKMTGRTTGKKDDNIVVFYKGTYYDVPPKLWKQGTKLGSALSALAFKNVIQPGDKVGYIPKKLAGQQPGGYSTVVNLDAVIPKR